MDSKKKIMSFIKPNATLAIVMMIPPLTLFGIIILLTTTIPANIQAKKSLEKLENSGKLDMAAADLSSPNAKRFLDKMESQYSKIISGEIVLQCNNDELRCLKEALHCAKEDYKENNLDKTVLVEIDNYLRNLT